MESGLAITAGRVQKAVNFEIERGDWKVKKARGWTSSEGRRRKEKESRGRAFGAATTNWSRKKMIIKRIAG